MLQYLPLILRCIKKVRHALKIMQHLFQGFQNVSDHAGASRNKGLTLKHERFFVLVGELFRCNCN